MWRTSTKLRCVCRLQAGALNRCGFCTPSSTTKPAATAATAAKGTQPPMTQPPPEGTKQQQQASPPPPPPSGGGGGGGGAFFKLLGLTLVGAGGVVGYAWYDPKFRKQLEDNVPGSKTALDAALAYLPPTSETPTAKATPALPSKPKTQGIAPIVADPEAVQRQGLARTIKVADPVIEKPGASAPGKVEDTKTAATLKKEAEKKAAAEKKEAEKKKAEDEKAKKQDMVERIIQEKEAEEAAENAALETILSDVLGETVEATRAALDSLNGSSSAIRRHVKALKTAMDEDAEGNVKNEQWKEVSAAHEETLQTEHRVENTIMDAKEALEKLHVAIKDGRSSKITRKNKALLGAEETHAQLSYDIKHAEANLERAKVESRVMDEYRDIIKKGREQFRKELESVKPEIRIGRRVGGRMTDEELNLLIAHAHRRIEQLQHQLAEQQAMEGLRMEKALHKQQLEDLRLADDRVGREMTHLKAQFELEKKRMEAQSEAQCEREIRHQLTRQAAAHSDHLSQVLTVQKDSLDKKYEQLLHDRVLAERDNIREEIAGWVSRLKGIETAIEARAEMEKLGRKAQELWLACQTLVTVIESGREGADSWEAALQPLEKEVAAIQVAGNEHPFVNTVVQALPTEAAMRGVWTKDALIDRFDKVQRVCRRVAMVDETGATLFKYFLSYIQSLLVVNPRPLTEQDELNPENLNAFVLVNNARHCLERGDLEQAVRYVNQLTGEPRRVAADWLKEARLLLETKQAADALLAHASSAGLGSLF